MLYLFRRLQKTKTIVEIVTTLRQILWHYFEYFAHESSRMSTTHVYSRSTCSGFFQPEWAGRNNVKCDITRQFLDHMHWRENISKHLSGSDHKQVQNLSSIPYHWFKLLSLIPRTAQFLSNACSTLRSQPCPALVIIHQPVSAKHWHRVIVFDNDYNYNMSRIGQVTCWLWRHSSHQKFTYHDVRA